MAAGKTPERAKKTNTRIRFKGLAQVAKANGSICSQEAIDKILAAMRMGAPVSGAAAAGGVSYPTLVNWRHADDEFDKECEAAIAAGRAVLEGTVLAGAAVDPYLALRILKARYPEDWMEKAKVDLTSGGQPIVGPLVAVVIAAAMTEDEIDARIRAIESGQVIEAQGREVSIEE